MSSLSFKYVAGTGTSLFARRRDDSPCCLDVDDVPFHPQVPPATGQEGRDLELPTHLEVVRLPTVHTYVHTLTAVVVLVSVSVGGPGVRENGGT